MKESLDDRLPAAAEEDPHTRRLPCCPPASLCGIARASCFAIAADVLGSGLLWRGLATPCAVWRARSMTPCAVWRARTEEEAGTDPAKERPCDPGSPAATCAQQARVRRGRCGGCTRTGMGNSRIPLRLPFDRGDRCAARHPRVLGATTTWPPWVRPKVCFRSSRLPRTTGFFWFVACSKGRNGRGMPREMGCWKTALLVTFAVWPLPPDRPLARGICVLPPSALPLCCSSAPCLGGAPSTRPGQDGPELAALRAGVWAWAIVLLHMTCHHRPHRRLRAARLPATSPSASSHGAASGA
jgi:hypothetical protein